MNENKRISIVSVIVCIISLLMAIFLSKEGKTLIYDLSLGIFTGAIISAITAIISFFTSKEEKIRNVIEEIENICEQYNIAFNSLDFVYFPDKLEKELKEKEIYEENEEWLYIRTKNNGKDMLRNLEKLSTLKLICYKLENLLNVLLSLKIGKQKKKIINRFIDLNNKIKHIISLSNLIKIEIGDVYINYPEIQNSLYKIRDKNGNEIKEYIEIYNNGLRPTNKVNIIQEEMNSLLKTILKF